MDGRTDRQTELRWLRHAESIAAFARKNQIKVNTADELNNCNASECKTVLQVL